MQVASIGPLTSKTAREQGLKIDIQARRYDIEGLVEAIRSFFAKEEGEGEGSENEGRIRCGNEIAQRRGGENGSGRCAGKRRKCFQQNRRGGHSGCISFVKRPDTE